MKELHNHIFSNAPCISKETMLKFINKQLSKDELYQVEKHMIDCELCSDAYEGILLAQNSSILFAIDNQIDQRVETGGAKSSILKTLMVAASILVIAFGAYFTFDYFENNVTNKPGLAVNEVEEIKRKIPLEEQLVDDALIETLVSEEVIMEANAQDSEYKKEGFIPKPILVEHFEIENKVVETFAEVSDFEEEEFVVLSNKKIDKNEEQGGALDETNTRVFYDKMDGNPIVVAEAIPIEQPKVKKANVRSKKSRIKSSSKTIVINSYKIVDYMGVYQEEFDIQSRSAFKTKSVPAGYENKKDLANIEQEVEVSIVEITYKETLEKAIQLYKNKEYHQAIEQFDVILAAHPDEVNGLFYRGLSYYHLQQYDHAKTQLNLVLENDETAFNEEANWYKALVLVELQETIKAKKLLKEIIITNGFYKAKAEEKLKGLH